MFKSYRTDTVIRTVTVASQCGHETASSSSALAMSFSDLTHTLTPRSIDVGDANSLPVVLLDGGMGTALELMGRNIADSPLWSASISTPGERRGD